VALSNQHVRVLCVRSRSGRRYGACN